MKCNIQEPPKTFKSLSQASKTRITEYFTEQLNSEKERVSKNVQRMMCKYFICACHDCDMDNEQITTILTNLRKYKRKLMRMKTNLEMEDYLDNYISTFMPDAPNYLIDKLTDAID